MSPAGGIEDRDVQPEPKLELGVRRKVEEKSLNGSDAAIPYRGASIACVVEDCTGDHDSPAPSSALPRTPSGHHHGLSFDRSDQEFFEVSFPLTGSLGITFEWAVDPAARASVTDGETMNSGDLATVGLRPRCTSGATTLPTIPSTISRRPRSADLSDSREEPSSIRPVSFPGGSIPTTPRKKFPPASLPPLPRPPTVDLTGSFVPHALRIQSLPLSSMEIPPSDARFRVTPNRTEVESAAVDAVVEARRATNEQESIEEKQYVDRASMPATSRETADKAPGTMTGPSTAHGILCTGDVLVAVNGKPVAGPAARRAGILSFQDAVDAVAEIVERRVLDEGEEVRRGQRILKFRRAARLTLPSSPTPTLMVPPPGKIEYVRGLSGRDATTEKDQGNASSARSGDSAESSDRPSGSGISPELLVKHMGQSAESKAREISIVSSHSKASLGTSDGSSRGSEKARVRRKWKCRGAAKSLRTVLTMVSKTERIKARRAEALLEPWICPHQQLIKHVLENSDTLRPVAVQLTNLSYWYQQRRLLGGYRHMHRKTTFHPNTKRWQSSTYVLRDRPSDGKLVPMLTPSVITAGKMPRSEGQALAQASKAARKRDANPCAALGPKPEGITPSTMLQTHIAVLVVSEVFMGLCSADRLAVVFTALFDGLVAAGDKAAMPTSAATLQRSLRSRSGTPERGSGLERENKVAEVDGGSRTTASSGSQVSRKWDANAAEQSRADQSFHGENSANAGSFQSEFSAVDGVGQEVGVTHDAGCVVRGSVKASFVGANIRALPIWGGLSPIAGTSLLVECRTPAQWQTQEFRPTGQELWCPAGSGHRTLANDPRVKNASVKKALERIVAESKALREAAPKFEHFNRFAERANGIPTTRKASKKPSKKAVKDNDTNSPGRSPSSSTRSGGSIDSMAGKRGRSDGDRTPPHFFHGLGANTRRLFLQLHAENRSRLIVQRHDTCSSLAKLRGGKIEERQKLSCGPRFPTQPSQTLGPTLRSVGEAFSVGGISKQSGGITAAEDNVRRAAGAFAASGPPPDIDAAILDRHSVLLARLTEAATRIQRVRRVGAFSCAARRLRRRQRTALFMQRVFRGYLGRRYAAIWKVLANLASTRISAGWRGFVSRRAFLVVRARARAGATSIQHPRLELLTRSTRVAYPIFLERLKLSVPYDSNPLLRPPPHALPPDAYALYRGHIGRRYAAYYAAHYNAVRSLQSGGRGFVARRRARRMRALQVWHSHGLPALLLIQGAVRGFLVRKAFSRRFEEAIRVKIVVLAAGVLQKCCRGKLGKKEAALRRRQKAMATEIQRHVRGYTGRRQWTRVLRWWKEHAMATKIAAVGRGYIDRELLKHRRAQRHFLHTVTPAAILIQTRWRGYSKRKDLAECVWGGLPWSNSPKRSNQALSSLDNASQRFLDDQDPDDATRDGHESPVLVPEMASAPALPGEAGGGQLETNLGFEDNPSNVEIGKTSYKINTKLDEMKEQWRVEKAALELVEAQSDIKEIKGDLNLCLEDIAGVEKSIAKTRRRRKELTEFRKEAGFRLLRVERHIEELTISDTEGGWAENYDREWDTLTNCMSMAFEEERIMKAKIAKKEQDLELLLLEIDDQEAELDEASSREFDRMEALRRMEIKRCLRRASRDRIRAVQRERIRWAVGDVRRNVIRRSRKDLVHFAELARAKRPRGAECTISYEVRRDRERDEEAEVRLMEREAREQRSGELKKKGEGNLVVRKCYNAVISRVRDIIATSTFDAGRAKTDYRGRGPDEVYRYRVGCAASAAATAAAAAARQNASALEDNQSIETAAAIAATDAAAAVTAAGSENSGGNVCGACGGPRFGRTVCAKCGMHASTWWEGLDG